MLEIGCLDVLAFLHVVHRVIYPLRTSSLSSGVAGISKLYSLATEVGTFWEAGTFFNLRW